MPGYKGNDLTSLAAISSIIIRTVVGNFSPQNAWIWIGVVNAGLDTQLFHFIDKNAPVSVGGQKHWQDVIRRHSAGNREWHADTWSQLSQGLAIKSG
jgi:hypothetical protein